MEIPCKNCLLIPACRHKEYNKMIDACGPLEKLMYKQRPNAPLIVRERKDIITSKKSNGKLRAASFKEVLKEIECTLKPTRWWVDDQYVMIMRILE